MNTIIMTKNKSFVSQSFSFNFNNIKSEEKPEKKNVSSDYSMSHNLQIRPGTELRYLNCVNLVCKYCSRSHCIRF